MTSINPENGLIHVTDEFGNQVPLYPLTTTSQVIDPESGEPLRAILDREGVTEVGKKLSRVITYGEVYLDSVNGNDNNDGLTPVTAWKTFKKLTGEVSNSLIVAELLVINLSGKFTEQLRLFNINGTVSIKGTNNIKAVIETSGIEEPPILLDRITQVGIDYVKLINKGSYFLAGEIVNVRSINFGENFELSQGSTASYGLVFNGVPSITFRGIISGFNIPIQIAYGSFLTLLNAGITGGTNTAVLAYASSAISIYSTRAGYTEPKINAFSGGLSIPQVNNSVIVEEGSNANGKYVKYANGVMECFQHYALPTGTKTSWTTGLYASPAYSWTFPARFKDVIVHVNIRELFGTGESFSVLGGMATSDTGTSYKMIYLTNSTLVSTITLYARGYWK